MTPDELVVSALCQADLVANAPSNSLLMERDVRDVVGGHGPCLMDHRRTFSGVGFNQNLVSQFVNFRVAVSAEVKFTAT